MALETSTYRTSIINYRTVKMGLIWILEKRNEKCSISNKELHIYNNGRKKLQMEITGFRVVPGLITHEHGNESQYVFMTI